jgi:nitroreductase
MVYDLEQAILTRRSTRLFLRDEPVPKNLVIEALELAIRAPSNSNIQPWRVVFNSGPARDRLVHALLEEAEKGEPQVPPLPEQFTHFRRDLGARLYGSMGVPRGDAQARRTAVLRNWEFFRAPLGAVVCMHRDLDYADALGVGMFLQTFMVALNARGIGSCVQVSIAGYPDVIREQLGIAEDMRILCGVSIGYADPNFPANDLDVPRSPLEDNVTFLES